MSDLSQSMREIKKDANSNTASITNQKIKWKKYLCRKKTVTGKYLRLILTKNIQTLKDNKRNLSEGPKDLNKYLEKQTIFL